MSWSSAQPRRSDLPVISRIVRRTRIERGALLGPIVRTASLARRIGLGTALFGALALATLGTIGGLGTRSPSDDAATSTAPGHLRSFDATATERLLARAPLALRADHDGPSLLRAEPPASRPAPEPARASPARTLAPSHATFAAAHKAAHAAKKHASATALARR